MELWYDLLSIVENVNLVEEEDQIIWSYNSNGRYFVQSLYAVITHRGIIPVYVHAVWKQHIPPRVQIFLWLLSKNKLLTRDNLAKRREVIDQTQSVLWRETINRLFFECIIAQRIWSVTLGFLNVSGECSFEIMTSRWIVNKRFDVVNIASYAILWCLWKIRNNLCF